MKIELTIKVDYLPTWGMQEGVRELLQNAKDAETEFSAPMSVRMRGNTLVIENDGCTLPYEALLLGHSSKHDRGDLIGKFGEGFKLGILALLRAGHSVKIRNGSEVWLPEIAVSEKFSARVLAFEILKNRKAENRIAIEIGGISPTTFAKDICPRFLWLRMASDKGARDRIATEHGTLLLDDSHKGKIFVKGIFVEAKPDLTVGYDLDVSVDRDRRMVDSFDFSWKTRMLWAQAMASRPDLFASYLDIIETNGPEAKHLDDYSARKLPEDFVTHAVEAFQARHGDKAIPVSNMGESSELEHFGRVGIVVNPAMRAILETRMGTLEQVQASLKNEVMRTYSWNQLDDSQRANLTRAVRLVVEHAPCSLSDINVVDFRSPGLQGTACGGSIQIAAKVLGSAADTLAVIVHEVAHANGGDGEKGHVAEIERIWSGIVESLSS